MQTYLKTKPVWVQVMLFLSMAFGFFTIALTIGAPLLGKLTGVSLVEFQQFTGWNTTNPAALSFMRGLIVLQFFSLFFLPPLVFAYFSDPAPAQYLGFRKPHHGWWWLLGLAAMIVAYPAVLGLGAINQEISFGRAMDLFRKMEDDAMRQTVFMLRSRQPIDLVKNILFVALLAGVGEELFFRGILQRLFIRATGKPWLGILITAAVFSAWHFQFFGFLPRLFLGVVLGAIYWYSGSIWVAMLVHFLYDAAVIVLLYFKPSMLDNPSENFMQGQVIALTAITVASLAATFLLLRRMQQDSLTSYEAVYSDDFPKPTDNLSF